MRRVAMRLSPLGLIALSSACHLSPLDVDAKACPCARGWTCDLRIQRCVRDELADLLADAMPPTSITDPVTELGDGGEDASVDAGASSGGSNGGAVEDAGSGSDAGTSQDAGINRDEDGATPPICPSVLLPGERLQRGEYRCSQNGKYRFELSSDGEVQLLDATGVVWSANVCCGEHLSMQRDGNLVLYDERGDPLFASNTASLEGVWLGVEDDGRVVLWLSGHVIWSTVATQ